MDSEQLKKEIEIVFRQSDSSGELFDTFKKAIQNKIKDVDLYKILLGNMSLSIDELKLFTEKICNEFSDLSFDIYFWAASILENASSNNYVDTAFEYYTKAINNNKLDYKPYLSIIKMYNPDIDLPSQNSIMAILKKGLDDVKLKSKLCYGIAEFYDKLNNQNMRNKYLALAANYVRKKI